jgi:hypothetical protein
MEPLGQGVPWPAIGETPMALVPSNPAQAGLEPRHLLPRGDGDARGDGLASTAMAGRLGAARRSARRPDVWAHIARGAKPRTV